MTPAPPTRRSPFTWVVPVVLLGGLIAAFALVGRDRPTTAATPPDEADLAPTPAPPGPPPAGMAWVPGGTFTMGDPDSQDGDAPWHTVGVGGFWIDKTEVTNAAWETFVAATGYRTVAERVPTKEQFPTARPENLVAGSAVFKPKPLDGPAAINVPTWWAYVKGADWRHPEGPESDLTGKETHPVVQIAWEDAAAYAAWAGKRLPTEAEWECAARGGLDRKPFVWGDAPQGADGRYFANTFQGTFPDRNAAADGFAGTSPVGRFPANGYGLFDMSGNAWEWCGDWYDAGYYARGPKRNPRGPADPAEIGKASLDEGTGQPQRVRRGGSILCADDYCRRYRVGSRDKNPPDSPANHTGFRCVKDVN